jgi:hypothetical protein
MASASYISLLSKNLAESWIDYGLEQFQMQARWRERHRHRRQTVAQVSNLLQRQMRSGEHLAELSELLHELLDPKELANLCGALKQPTAKRELAPLTARACLPETWDNEQQHIVARSFAEG